MGDNPINNVDPTGMGTISAGAGDATANITMTGQAAFSSGNSANPTAINPVAQAPLQLKRSLYAQYLHQEFAASENNFGAFEIDWSFSLDHPTTVPLLLLQDVTISSNVTNRHHWSVAGWNQHYTEVVGIIPPGATSPQIEGDANDIQNAIKIAPKNMPLGDQVIDHWGPAGTRSCSNGWFVETGQLFAYQATDALLGKVVGLDTGIGEKSASYGYPFGSWQPQWATASGAGGWIDFGNRGELGTNFAPVVSETAKMQLTAEWKGSDEPKWSYGYDDGSPMVNGPN